MRTFVLLSLILLATVAMAQDAAPTWLEDSLYGGGKMNAVVAVVGIIIIGIGLWMFRMDRRLRKMEEQVK